MLTCTSVSPVVRLTVAVRAENSPLGAGVWVRSRVCIAKNSDNLETDSTAGRFHSQLLDHALKHSQDDILGNGVGNGCLADCPGQNEAHPTCLHLLIT